MTSVLVIELDIVNNSRTLNFKCEVIEWHEYKCDKITLSFSKFMEVMSDMFCLSS